MVTIQERLQQFPRREEDTHDRLLALVQDRAKIRPWTAQESNRLNEELSIIKDTQTSAIFLLLYDIRCALRDCELHVHWLMQSSFLCYHLGITETNPLAYGLPFARLLHRESSRLPNLSVAVKKGVRGRVIKYLASRYGYGRFAGALDSPNEFLLSAKPIWDVAEPDGIILRAHPRNETVWLQRIATVARAEADKMGLCVLAVEEREFLPNRALTEEEIYQKTLQLFSGHRFETDTGYAWDKETAYIFKNTDSKLVYQEQFFLFLEKSLGADGERIDRWRKAILTGKYEQSKPLATLLQERFGQAGKAIFFYVQQRLPYAVSKAYVIGQMFIKEEEIGE